MYGTALTERRPVARFPTHGLRNKFLEQIHLWNSLEDLPCIETELLTDGVCVRFRCADGSDRGIRLLRELGTLAPYRVDEVLEPLAAPIPAAPERAFDGAGDALQPPLAVSPALRIDTLCDPGAQHFSSLHFSPARYCGRRQHRSFATFSLRPPQRTAQYAIGALQSEGRGFAALSAPSLRDLVRKAG